MSKNWRMKMGAWMGNKGRTNAGAGTVRGMEAGFLQDENGMGTVEIILIIVVLIGLVIIFRNQLTTLVNNIFTKMTSESNVIIGSGVSG